MSTRALGACVLDLTAFSSEERDGPHPGAGSRAAKEGHLARAAGVREGHRAQTPRVEPARSLPLSRRPDAVARHHAGQEPLALPGGVPGGRERDRLGDAGRGRELPPCGGAFARRRSLFRRCFFASDEVGGGGAQDDDAQARAGDRAQRRRRGADEAGGRLLPRDAQGEPGGPLLSRRARIEERRDGGALPDRICEPDARVPSSREEPQAWGRAARRVAADRDLARERARALQRVDRDPHRGRGGAGDRDVRPEDHGGSARGDAAASVFSRSASGGFQRGGPRREPRDPPVRGADRRVDVLVRGHPERDVELRRGGLHRRSPERVSAPRHRDGEDRLRPRRGGRPSGGEAERGAERDGDRHLPGAVSQGHGRQRVRAQGAACGQVAGRGGAARAVDGQGPAAGGGGAGGRGGDRAGRVRVDAGADDQYPRHRFYRSRRRSRRSPSPRPRPSSRPNRHRSRPRRRNRRRRRASRSRPRRAPGGRPILL